MEIRFFFQEEISIIFIHYDALRHIIENATKFLIERLETMSTQIFLWNWAFNLHQVDLF